MYGSILDIEFNPHKYLAHWDRLNALASGMDVRPVTLELDLSSKCGHRCKWCVDPPGSHLGIHMPTATAMNILYESRDLGVKGVIFKGGGESTLHPDFPGILEAAAGMGFETGIVTNGSMLGSDAVLDSIAENASYVRISIDGPDRESRMLIHGVDDSDDLIGGLKRLVEKRGVRRHPVIGASFCMDCSMAHLLRKCIDLGEACGVDYVLIRPPFCEEVGYTSPDTPEALKKLRSDILAAAQRHKGKTYVMAGNWTGDAEYAGIQQPDDVSALSRRDLCIDRSPNNGIEHITHRCPASRLYLVITADGEVYGCCCLRKISGYSFGKLDYENGVTLNAILAGKQRAESLYKMENARCLMHCTHPLKRVNEIIEYLRTPEKFHSSFL